MRSRLEPMKKIARSIRNHRPLILNWFRARGQVSAGAVEGLNNKVKLVTRKSYGFRTAKVAKLALMHNLGQLPEPETRPQILLTRQKPLLPGFQRNICFSRIKSQRLASVRQ